MEACLEKKTPILCEIKTIYNILVKSNFVNLQTFAMFATCIVRRSNFVSVPKSAPFCVARYHVIETISGQKKPQTFRCVFCFVYHAVTDLV